VVKPWPGGEKRRGERASHHVELRGDWVVSPPVCGHRGVPARGVVPERCNASGSAVDDCRDTPAGARRAARGRWRWCGRSVRPLWVATCAVHDCATRGSIPPLLYPQLLAAKEMTSRYTGDLSTVTNGANSPTPALTHVRAGVIFLMSLCVAT